MSCAGPGAAFLAAGSPHLVTAALSSLSATISGSPDTLEGTSVQFAGDFIASFGSSLQIDVTDLRHGVSGFAMAYSGTSTQGVLSSTDGVHDVALEFAGNVSRSLFYAASDGHGGTIVSYWITHSRRSTGISYAISILYCCIVRLFDFVGRAVTAICPIEHPDPTGRNC